MPSRLSRVAFIVSDIDKYIAAFQKQFEMRFKWPEVGDVGLRVAIGEHGFEPIQPLRHLPYMDGIPHPLLEVAIATGNADEVKDALGAAGYQPKVVNYMPVVKRNEYLFGPDLHGIPLMVCTDGDEAELAPFKDLESADPPKIGCVTLVVKDLAQATADFQRFFGMTFTPTDPAGFGDKAMVGPHRVKLVQAPAGGSPLAKHFPPPLAALEIMVADVEEARGELQEAGIGVVRERILKSGRKSYYLGSQFEKLPLAIYAAADDAEIRGLAG